MFTFTAIVNPSRVFTIEAASAVEVFRKYPRVKSVIWGPDHSRLRIDRSQLHL